MRNNERKDDNSRVLRYWLDVEKSSPPIIKINRFNLKNKNNFNQLIFMNDSNSDLVWGDKLNKSLDKPRGWIHRVYLGVYSTSLIIDEFSSDAKEVNELKMSHNTCLVSFMLDSDGNPIQNTLVIPEYLTYIYKYKNSNLPKSELDGFEDRVREIFYLWISNINASGEFIGKRDLTRLLNSLIVEINWDGLSDYYRHKSPKYIGYSESISTINNRKISFDSEITNSLISDDIKFVIDAYELTDEISSLDYYLDQGVDKEERVDVVLEKEEYRKYLSPSYIPDSSFPYPEKIKLNLSQQYAVNKIFNLLEDRSGIFSVNGPPGTGKTTIFKDIMANIIYLRATELIKFKNDPNKAFVKIGDISYRFGDNGEKPIYSIDKSLAGFEIVVSSSNNNAIKNITDELPKNSGIDEAYVGKFKYMKRIADNVYNEDCWGLMSATLGNRSNNFEFMNSFLFKSYDDEKLTTKESIFDFLNNPKYFSETVSSWSSACAMFENAVSQVERFKGRAVQISSYLNDYSSTVDLHKEMVAVRDGIKNDIIEHKNKYKASKRALDRANLELRKIKREIKTPKMFKGREKEDLHSRGVKIQTDVTSLKHDLLEIADSFKLLKIDYDELSDTIMDNGNTIKQMMAVNKNFSGVNSDYPNDAFWNSDQEFIQKCSVWVDKGYSRARKNLFVASMNLHKSFVIENSHYFTSNLRTLKDILEGEFYEKDLYTKSIIQSLFIMIPVISTTLYSFNKLFNSFSVGEIGWLLIDEAGQTTPQLPVPALFRSKRAIFCGDPMQIEPVISIEDKLSDALIEKNKISQGWNSCSFSAQQIADRNNFFGTYLGLGKYRKWFGSPLRVHKRCLNPMFKISNKIAYDGKMIYDTSYDDEKFRLGESTWFHIESEPKEESGHYIEEEVGFLIRAMAMSFRGCGNTPPNIFVITPFRDVMFSAQRTIIDSHKIIAPMIGLKDFTDWVKSNVGTIHSFQGKEADIVFLLIGGDKYKTGAISWLSTEPNILNVSVTRSRKRLYIIGNAKVWNKGVFRLIREYIKIKRVN